MNNLSINILRNLKLLKIINLKENLINQEKIKQLHNLAQLGKLSAGIFHDLINPLTVIALNLEEIKQKNGPQMNRAYQCLNQALVATRHMEKLLMITKQQLNQQAQITNFNLYQQVEEVISMLTCKAKLAQVKLQIEIPNNIEIKGSAPKFGRVLINLISNGIEACVDSQSLNKTVKIIAKTDKNFITIQIIDNGCGLSQKVKKQIFQAFFSTKNGKQAGSGLGLSISQDIIINDFAGKIKLADHPWLTIFQITLPN